MESLKPRKVMLVSPDFGTGGAEHSMARLSRLLVPFYDVHFVVFNKDRERVYPVEGSMHSLNVAAGRSLPEKAIRFWQRLKRLRRLKLELQIDVSISFLEGANYVNVLSAGKDKTVVSVRGSHTHDEEIRGLLGWFRKSFLMPWCYTRADRVVAVSQGIGKELERDFGISHDRIAVITNAYSIDALVGKGKEALPKEVEWWFEKPVVMAVGRLHPQKNYKSLLVVASLLKKEKVAFRLVILGDGDQLPELAQVCSSLGLTSSEGSAAKDVDVVFGGYQSNPWSFISRATVFVLSSLWEGFPNAMAEAMCLGVPTVATDCPYGPQEIFDDVVTETRTHEVKWGTSGVLIPSLPGEMALLQTEGTIAHKTCVDAANVLKMLLEDPTRLETMGRAGQERMKKFNEVASLESWRQLIES